jgi:DNA primase
MALPPEFLDELRARTPLPALIGRRTRLTKSGRNWKGCCPFHNEKTPSFYVYDDHFHCFGCGAHGDAIGFAMRAEGGSFPEVVERLAAEAGLQVPKPSPAEARREEQRREAADLLAEAQAIYARRLHAPEGAEALAYLRRRGLTDATIARFGLGWSGAGRGELFVELRQKGATEEQLRLSGLAREREEGSLAELFWNRAMFPIRDRHGRVIAFGGRIMGDGQPKYVNSPETPAFSKRRTLYGLDLAREAAFRGATVVAVEGYMDVIALHQAGFAGAVAPLGTALTEEQLDALWQLSPEPVLCFDGDAAGARAAARAAEVALPLLQPDRSLRFATLPAGEDPDTLIAAQGAGGFQAALDAARPMGEALYGLLTAGQPSATPEQRAALRHRLAAAAARIPDRALAGEYRSALFERFFATRRSGHRAAPLKPPRPVITADATRAEQARCLLAIALAHPWLAAEAEEALGALELPPGRPAQLKDALLAWLAGSPALDSGGLADHLRAAGLSEALAWAGAGGVPRGVLGAEARPAEAVEAWWHFFGLLKGDAELDADRRAAERDLAATNDPAAQRRLTLLSEALSALRRGEAGGGA